MLFRDSGQGVGDRSCGLRSGRYTLVLADSDMFGTSPKLLAEGVVESLRWGAVGVLRQLRDRQGAAQMGPRSNAGVGLLL